MLGGKPVPEEGQARIDGDPPQAIDWIALYGRSHAHPINQACHLIGIPLIVLSLALGAVTPWQHSAGWPGLGLFVLGWAFQFAGHAVEGRPPEFLQHPRFLLVGVRWWCRKVGSYISSATPSR